MCNVFDVTDVFRYKKWVSVEFIQFPSRVLSFHSGNWPLWNLNGHQQSTHTFTDFPHSDSSWYNSCCLVIRAIKSLPFSPLFTLKVAVLFLFCLFPILLLLISSSYVTWCYNVAWGSGSPHNGVLSLISHIQSSPFI